jgi:hypothetical protein
MYLSDYGSDSKCCQCRHAGHLLGIAPVFIGPGWLRLYAGLKFQRGLKLGSTYKSYCEAWFKYSDSDTVKKLVSDTCIWLPKSHYWRNLVSLGVVTDPALKRWMGEAWFRDRIVDVRLWNLGNPAGQDHDVQLAEVAKFCS